MDEQPQLELEPAQNGTPAQLELPPEVLARIIAHIPPRPASQTLFNSLSLVSRAALDLVRQVRYSSIALPSAHSASLLLNNSSAPTRALIRAQLRTITLGPNSTLSGSSREGDAKLSDAPFAECLAVFGERVERLSARGLNLSPALFWSIRHTLTTLDLRGCIIAFRSRDFRLPALERLVLQGVEHASHEMEWDDFLANASLPNLTSLALLHSSTGNVPETSPDRTAAMYLLAPRLTELSLAEDGAWLGAEEVLLWAHLDKLRKLHIVEPRSFPSSGVGGEDEIGDRLVNALHSIAHPLEELNIATPRKEGFATTAWNVCFALRERLTSVRKLRRLVLPEGERGGYACEVLEGEARGRGVVVEYERAEEGLMDG